MENSNQIAPIQALNAVFNFARSVAATAAQHDQIRSYCELLAKTLEENERELMALRFTNSVKPAPEEKSV